MKASDVNLILKKRMLNEYCNSVSLFLKIYTARETPAAVDLF
jgi:hypothetical protein